MAILKEVEEDELTLAALSTNPGGGQGVTQITVPISGVGHPGGVATVTIPSVSLSSVPQWMARLKMEPGTITTTSNLSNNIGSVINPSPGTAVVTTTGGMAGVTSLSLASMDCYEDMFKEITKKLYGDEGLAEVIGGDAHQNIVYETDGFRTDGTTTIATGPAGLTLIQTGANGLAPGTILIQRRIQDEKGRVWTVEGLPQQGDQISLATVTAPSHPPPPVVTTTTAAPAVPIEERWFESEEILHWTTSKIARYNPSQKVFRCVDCDFVGFLSRVAEHWLGNHASLRVFQCPRCPYTSAWARCVRMHLTRQHGETLTDNSLWKENPVLEEVTKYLNGLKTKVEQKGDTSIPGEKRYTCPYCTYATDRRDLFNRHENIHRDEKPFQCYVCDKQFNRADHVKKHFMRMHRDHPYDINKIRKNLPKSHGGAVPFFNNKFQSKQLPVQNTENELTQEIDTSALTTQPITLQLQGGANQTVTLQQIPHIAYFNPPATPGQTGPLQGIPGVGGNKKEAKAKGAKKKKSGEKMYSCSYCPWQGVDNWCLKRHLNTHIKPFLCALCDYKAARSERLATHVLKVHNKRVCHKCSFLADDTESLSQHIQDSHQNPLVKTGFHCNVCQEYFELRADLEAHAILEHQKVIVQCDLCDFRTTDELSMESHLRDKHNLQPGMGAVAAAAAAAAAAAITGQPQMQLASAPTMQMSETIPVEQQQQEEPQSIVPDHHLSGTIATEDHAYHDSSVIIQPKQEPGIDILEESLAEPEADPATLCEQCGIDFLDEPSLRLHEKRHEIIPKPVVDTKSARTITRNYFCSTCSYTCATKKMMLQHQRAHTGFELECRADGCQFTTPFENSLKEHIHVDHNEDAVRCPHCGLKMASLNCFTIHWRFHHATLCSLCVNVYKVKYCVKENDIHDIILKSPLQLLNGDGDISGNVIGGSNKGSQDGIPMSERETQRIEDNLHITNNNEFRLGGEPPMKKARLELFPNLSPISNMYKREALKVLPKLVELAVSPVTFKQHRENIRKQKKIKLSRMRRKGGRVVVSHRRRYTPRGSVNNVMFRSVRDRDGFKCHSLMCEKACAYRNKGQLVLHNIWYHTRPIFKCDNCDRRYPHLYQALLHKMREHPPHLQQHAQIQLHQHQLQLQLQQHHVHHQNELAVHHAHHIIGSFKTE